MSIAIVLLNGHVAVSIIRQFHVSFIVYYLT